VSIDNAVLAMGVTVLRAGRQAGSKLDETNRSRSEGVNMITIQGFPEENGQTA